MRDPDFEVDGWELDNGEEYHRDAPSTFWIPDRSARETLKPGDYAKLIFRFAVDSEEFPVAVERMWVVVRERLNNQYFGLLDNEPDAIEENDEFWLGTEVPFRAEHVIDILPADKDSIDLAAGPPRRAWPRD